ncbi:MAG: hypothetical protein ACYTEQ_00790 [Planctomycetota bacterium]|jgi:hypothetical protein
MTDEPTETLPAAPESTEPILPTVRDGIRSQLGEVDETTGEGSSLVAMWDELSAINDINNLLPHNIHQIQLQHDVAQKKYWKRVAAQDAELREARKDMTPGGVRVASEMADEFRKEQVAMQKHLQGMVKTVAKMLTDYNKIMLNRERFVDIAQVMEFRLALQASVNMHVTEQSTRDKIATDMRNLVQDYLKAARDVT